MERERTIVSAAFELLTEGGLAALTTSALAARAGVSKATVYQIWSNKTDLLVGALDHAYQQISVEDMGDFEAELRAFLGKRYAQYASPGWDRLLASLVGASAEDPLVEKAFREWVAKQVGGHRVIIERAIARGQLPADADVDTISSFIAAPGVYRLVWEGMVPDETIIDATLCTVRALARTPKS
ncbi:hypothetical protein AXA44_30945 [Rhodococcus sp. SC4]|nr:hypothetical protein AXA44_30945 [Rhodococcus sp. SC4]